MRKSLIAAAIAGTFSFPPPSWPRPLRRPPPRSPHTFTGNVGIVSDYLFRGISQTRGKPALQGGFDYAHSSGFMPASGPPTSPGSDRTGRRPAPALEIDIYGGYKGTLTAATRFMTSAY
jgi:uncharacterized protein (TIGR02001 family)